MLIYSMDMCTPSSEWIKTEKIISDGIKKLTGSQNHGGYTFKLMLLLIQNKDYTNVGEYDDIRKLLDERISSLRKKNEMESKQISFMNARDISIASPSITKLITMCDEFSDEYYHEVGRLVKKSKRYVCFIYSN